MQTGKVNKMLNSLVVMDKDLLFNKVFMMHKKQLNNLSVKNVKLIVCFSGIPGSGKTHISKILEKRYRAVRVNSDDVRRIIKELVMGESRQIEQKRQEILQSYLIWFIENYKCPNKLIVLDSSIDRKHKLINKVAGENGFKVLTVGLKVDEKTAVKRAIKRNGGKEDLHFTKNIGRWIKENKKFSRKGKIDVVIANMDRLDLSRLFSKLDRLI